MPTYPATGIVLHRLSLGETDRILTLYTRERGKVSAVAKGARRPGSRLSGATEPFTVSRMLLATGKSLDIVTQCEIAESFPDLRTDLERLARASYFCELLDQLTLEHDPSQSEELFEVTVSALTLLTHATGYLDGVVHSYELRLLQIGGYAPAIDHCVRCGASLAGRMLGFSPSLGGALCSADRYRVEDAMALSERALDELRLLLTGNAGQLLALNPDHKTAAELARALRWYIRYRLDRELKSGEFLDQLRAGRRDES